MLLMPYSSTSLVSSPRITCSQPAAWAALSKSNSPVLSTRDTGTSPWVASMIWALGLSAATAARVRAIRWRWHRSTLFSTITSANSI